MIKERERERLQKENQEKARRLHEERLREERQKKLLNGENARVGPVIQKSGQIKRILATQQNNSSASQQSAQGFAMIRTLGGQTYKIPVSALQGKKIGQQIVIKTGNPNSGQFTNTTTATIISTYTQPTNVTTGQQASTTTTTVTSSVQPPAPSTTTVRPLILSSAGSSAQNNLATGISASSLAQQQKINLVPNQSTPQKIQFIKQITAPIVSSQPISTSSTAATTAVATTPSSQPAPTQPAAPTTTTIKIIPSLLAGSNVNANSNSPVQLAIKLPDGRMQLIQLPASMLNSSTPIQITIPNPPPQSATPATSTTSTTSTVTTSSTPTQPIIRTIQTTSTSSSPSPQIIRKITPSANSSPMPTILRNVSSPTPNASQPASPQITRAITPIAPPIVRAVTGGNVITQMQLPKIISRPVTSVQPKETEPASATNVKSSPGKPAAASVAAGTPSSVPKSASTVIDPSLLQHQQLDDQLNQSDSLIRTEESSFKLTPQYTQEMVKAALSSKTNTPEIHQKLLALQKHTQQAVGDDESSVKSTPANQLTANQLRRSTAGGLVRGSLSNRTSLASGRQSASQSRLQSLSSSKGMEEERDDIVIKTILKMMVDKIDKDEKLEQRRKKARETQLQAKWRQSCIRQNAKLNRNAELVRKEMLKRRALFQKGIREATNQEINCIVRKLQLERPASQQSAVSPRNSGRTSGENSLDQPFGDWRKKEERNGGDLSVQQLGSASEVQSRAAHSSSREMAAISSAPGDCVNSQLPSACLNNTRDSSTGKRKSTTGILYHNNNNLKKNASSTGHQSIPPANRSSTAAKLIGRKREATSTRRQPSKRTKQLLLAQHLSEQQFNDHFANMDASVDTEAGSDKPKRLYCLCKQPYDSKQFMIGK